MSQVKISGNASGTGVFTVASPNSNNTQTLTLPDATATLVGDTSTQTLTNKTLGSGLVAGASIITSGTAVASTSGTSIDFTSIPSWVKRITVMFNGVSLSGTSTILVQLGAGSVTSSGYTSGSYATNNSGVTSTAGFIFVTGAASTSVIGLMTICLITGNTWVSSHSYNVTTASASATGGGVVSLSGTLDRVRITTSNGTDTFDAGSINILYE